MSIQPIHRDLYIDGRSQPASTDRQIERYNPANGQLVGRFAKASADDAIHAVAAARRAFDDGPWPRMAPAERAEIMLETARLLRENTNDLALWESLTSGIPLATTCGSIESAAKLFTYYAGLARDIKGETVDLGEKKLGLVLKEPVGVVSQLIPWNFPLGQATWKVCPALAAGCTIVAKPDSKTPVTTLELARIMTKAGLPDGVLNVIVGNVEDLSEVLTGHPDIDAVSLTGSTESGKVVMRNAADTVKRVHLELGGKSPQIVFADADLDAAADAAAEGIFWRSGQVCNAGSRILVHESVQEKFLELLNTYANGLTIGDPMDDATVVGPLISPEHRERVERYVKAGVDEGATLARGGRRPENPPLDAGCYYPPTIFTDVTMDMTIAQEEIFGPVACILPFRDTDEALDIANQTRYGLAAGVWTRELNTAMQMSRRLKAGTVWVNNFGAAHAELPFGGYKMSGFSRELGREGLEEYLQTKTVQLGLDTLGKGS